MSQKSLPRAGAHNAQPARHTPRKRFGQHFIADRNILSKLVHAAKAQPGTVVLEIGPGLGSLTRVLAEAGARVAAVEVDQDLVAQLTKEFANSIDVQVLQGDVLTRPPTDWLAQAKLLPPYVVVANLPYYITSAVLRYLLEAESPPSRIVVMVQREVAQQIIARPPHMNLLAVSVQYYASPRVVDLVPAGAFYPRPKVDSAIVRMDVHPRLSKGSTEFLFQVVRAGFSARRKQLRNALAHGLGRSQDEVLFLLTHAGLDPSRRAETLSLDEWQLLAELWRKLAAS
jgi:16S rRNA (adenine1518-N6/adenine1519-N6)-dimethyltransferase